MSSSPSRGVVCTCGSESGASTRRRDRRSLCACDQRPKLRRLVPDQFRFTRAVTFADGLGTTLFASIRKLLPHLSHVRDRVCRGAQPERLDLDEPRASFWSYAPPSSSKVERLALYSELAALRPTTMTFPLYSLTRTVPFTLRRSYRWPPGAPRARGEPEPVVDELGEGMSPSRGASAAIEADGLDGATRVDEDGTAGGLVHAARLHADEARFDDVEAADAVVATVLVERGEHGGGGHALTSMATGSPFSKSISMYVLSGRSRDTERVNMSSLYSSQGSSSALPS